MCSDFIKCHHGIDKLKRILYKTNYIPDLLDKGTKEFLDKILAPKFVVSAMPKEYLLFYNHTPDFEDLSILANNSNNFKVTLMDSLLINRDHTPFNKNKQTLPLGLCDS